MPPINILLCCALAFLISLTAQSTTIAQVIVPYGSSPRPVFGPYQSSVYPPPFYPSPTIQTVLPDHLTYESQPVLPTPAMSTNRPTSEPTIGQQALVYRTVDQIPFTDAPPKPVALESNTLAELIDLEAKIQKILPGILPAVVSIEGGSGVIVRPDGVILTASHVTKKANRFVKVQFSNGRVAVARTLGTNTNSDTAALKLLDSGPWPFVALESSSAMQPGDWCFALGYPLSFHRNESAALRIGRVLKVSESRIVTDCTIMGGDSGGPLVNTNGKVFAISSRVKTNIDQNFHVPIEEYQNDWSQIAASVDVRSPAKETKVVRSYLGILGETDIDRVRIRQVIQGSPAQKAGLMTKDVILELDGKRVSKFDDVLATLEIRKPGEQVLAKLNRFGTLINVSIQLESGKGVRR